MCFVIIVPSLVCPTLQGQGNTVVHFAHLTLKQDSKIAKDYTVLERVWVCTKRVIREREGGMKLYGGNCVERVVTVGFP